MKRFLCIIIALMLLAGCSAAPADKKSEVMEEDTRAEVDSKPAVDEDSISGEKGFIIGDEVRVRQGDDAKTEVVATLDAGKEVKILKKSESKAVVGRYEDYWYNIEFDGKKGWCFGEFISSETELKDRLKTRFDNFIKSGESGVKDSAGILLKFAKMGADKAMLDDGVRKIMKLQADTMEKYDSVLADSTVLQEYRVEELNDPRGVDDINLKKQLMQIKENGYNIYWTEGMFYIEPDPSFYLDKFETYLSEQLVEFLKLEKVEVKAHFGADGGLLISWDELSDRIAGWDRYIAKYPDAPETAKAKDEYYRRYMYIYLTGTDNSGLYDPETQMLKDDVRKSYERYMEKYKDTEGYKAIKDFYEALKKNDFKRIPQ